MDKKGLFYAHAKIVNLPLNRVQSECANISMKEFSAQMLLDIFNQGLKIALEPLYKIDNKSAHMPYMPLIVPR